MSTQKSVETSAPAKLPSSLLLCEALNFAPQLLLDDIINAINNSVQDSVMSVEEFLLKNREEKLEAQASEPAPVKGKKGKKHKSAEEEAEEFTQELEQGLVAFQTLLEYHVDIAFDFFEAWSLRNIFFIAPELEHGDVVVLPRYEGADLTGGEGGTALVDNERETMEQIDELRKRLDEQRHLTRLLKRGIATAKGAKTRAGDRYNNLIHLLPSEPLSQMSVLPEQLNNLYGTISSLPPPDPLLGYSNQQTSQEGSSSLLSGTGQRPWERGTTGYVNWAVTRLVDGRGTSIPASRIAGESGSGLEANVVDRLEAATARVGKARDLRGAAEILRKPIPRSGEGEMDEDK